MNVPLKLRVMIHLNSQWMLPGSSSNYHVVWWHDDAAKDSHRHVPTVTVMSLLQQWLVSRRLTLRAIDEALGGAPAGRASRMESDRDVEQLGKRIAEAIRTGRMVVVQAIPSNASITGISSHAPRKPGHGESVTVVAVDEKGEVMPDARYRIKTAGRTREGVLDPHGKAHEDNVDLDKLEITLLK